MIRAARKSWYHNHSEYCDFGHAPQVLAISVILHHSMTISRLCTKSANQCFLDAKLVLQVMAALDARDLD